MIAKSLEQILQSRLMGCRCWRHDIPYLQAAPLLLLKQGVRSFSFSLTSHDDVVDRDEHELDSEAHDGKTNGACNCDFLELLGIRLCAPLDKTPGVLSELVSALDAVAERVALVRQEWRQVFQGGHALSQGCTRAKCVRGGVRARSGGEL